jgi:hypothetical protein
MPRVSCADLEQNLSRHLEKSAETHAPIGVTRQNGGGNAGGVAFLKWAINHTNDNPPQCFEQQHRAGHQLDHQPRTTIGRVSHILNRISHPPNNPHRAPQPP